VGSSNVEQSLFIVLMEVCISILLSRLSAGLLILFLTEACPKTRSNMSL
jgi:hypothetical protein